MAPFSRNSGVGHSGSWPPLHCGDSTNLAPEVVPGASLHSEALSPECGRECPGTGDCGPTRHVGAGRWGLLLADCSRVARAMTPGPPPQPHGWVRLGFEVLRFPDFWRGTACADFPRGVEFRGSLAPFFLHILKKKGFPKKHPHALHKSCVSSLPTVIFITFYRPFI